MADDSDRTVFKQPMPGGDRTSLRPSPGRRPAPGDSRQRSGGDGGGMPPQPPGGGQPPRGPHNPSFNTFIGLNPLVNAASTLIAVFQKTQNSPRHPDVAGLHRSLTQEIRSFEDRAKDAGVRPEISLSARYLLCSALDEAVLHTPWGGESAWGQRTLLSAYHGETSGGEKCFIILENMLHEPAENLHILELFYVVLSLGFEGRYRLESRGRDKLESLRDDLYRAIRTYRGDFERSLSLSWQGLGRGRRTLSHYIPAWVAGSVFAAIVLMGYAGFSFWMHSESESVLRQLQVIAGTAEPTDLKETNNQDTSNKDGQDSLFQ